jgi:peptide/nickel transport system ATP-binding protein
VKSVATPFSDRDVVLEVEGLSVAFPGGDGVVPALRGVDFRLNAGEVLGVVGESGSGKSLAALAVMGLLPRHARVTGSVRFRGTELLTMSDKLASTIRGNRIAMVFQDPLSALNPVLTVGDQIAEAVRVHCTVSKRQATERAVELLDLVGVPDPRARAATFPHQCSGGMRQRVMIAIAIANDPDVIIADEPTTALDVTIQAQILEVLRTARAVTGAGVVVITHDLGVIAGLADRVQVMYAGRLVESGSVDDIFHRSRMPYTVGLLGSLPRLDMNRNRPPTPIKGSPPSLTALPPGCPFAPRCRLAIDACAVQEPVLRPMPATGTPHLSACHRTDDIHGDAMADLEPSIPIAPEAGPMVDGQRTTVLTVSGLAKSYPLTTGRAFRRRSDSIRAVDGISFTIHQGETLALVGESGCGKTTTLLEVLRLARPQHGRIVVLGRDTATMTTDERFSLRRSLQMVFQDPLASLDPRMPIGDILDEPLRTHGVPKADRTVRVHELLRDVGLDLLHVDRYPHEFSGGERQRIAIARALALRPRLLMLDEPVSALDVSIRATIIDLLRSLRTRLGLSYLLVSHDLAMVRQLADRIAVMYLGQLLEVGPVDRVFEAPRHPYTQALLSAIPYPDPRRERARNRIVLLGDPDAPGDSPSGCRFRTRCQLFRTLTDERKQRCRTEAPTAVVFATSPADPADHRTACHYAAPLRVL